MGLKPVFGSGDDLKKLFRLRSAFQLCLALPLGHPEDGVVRVGINGFVVQALVPAEGKSMDDGQELPDIIGTSDWAEVKHLITRLQVNSLIFHRTRIAGTGRIHGPRIGTNLHRQWKYGVVAVVGRVLCGHYYMRSGTSIPRRPIPFLMILATFLASMRRTAFFCSSGSLRIE